MGFLYELESQLETMKAENAKKDTSNVDHMAVIKNNLPVITDFCGMKPYAGKYDYASLKSYMTEAENILSKEGNKLTLKADAMMSALIREIGREGVIQLKKDNYNLKLEDFVVGLNPRMVEVVDNCLVPRTGIVYLTPRSHIGRAPFYSSEKILGSSHIKTLKYNMGVLLLMCIIMGLLLFTDTPGRFIRKGES